MQLFLKKIILFSLPLFLGLCLFDVFLTYNLKKSNKFQGEIEVWNAIYKGEIDTEVAIYGSSRAWTQLNPDILANTLKKSVYNFGIDGHNFMMQYLRHLEYLKYNTKPKVILFNVDIFTLEKRKDLYNLEQFLPYLLWNKTIRSYTKSYNGFSKVAYYIPFFRYVRQTKAIKNAFHNFTNTDTISLRNRGFKAFDLSWEEKENFINKVKEYRINIDKETQILFERFIAECNNLNIQLVLTYTPEHKDGQKIVVNRNKIVAYYAKIAKKYNIPFVNYSQENTLKDKKYYYNSMHLNKKGANIISQIIANDLSTLSAFNTKKSTK